MFVLFQMTTSSSKLTPADIAKLLNKELQVAASEISDVITDYFGTSGHDSDSSADSDLDEVDFLKDTAMAMDESTQVESEPDTDPTTPWLPDDSEIQKLAKHVSLYSGDTDDSIVVAKFYDDGCKCSRNCVKKFKPGELLLHRLQLREIDYYDVDHVNAKNQMIVSQFAVLCDTGETTSSSHKQQTARVKSRNSQAVLRSRRKIFSVNI